LTQRFTCKSRPDPTLNPVANRTAERLIRHLARAGFVPMRETPGAAPTTAIMPSLRG